MNIINKLPDLLVFAMISFISPIGFHVIYEFWKIRWKHVKDRNNDGDLKDDEERASDGWHKASPFMYMSYLLSGCIIGIWVLVDIALKGSYSPFVLIPFALWLISVQTGFHLGSVNKAGDREFFFGHLTIPRGVQFLVWMTVLSTTTLLIIIQVV